MRTVGPALALAVARARRRPGRGLAPALGIALAVAFLGAVWAEGTIAGEQAARARLASLTLAQRAVTVTWQGAATHTVDHQAQAALGGLGLGPITTATLLSPVRLNGHLVRPAAIAPLGPWTACGWAEWAGAGSMPRHHLSDVAGRHRHPARHNAGRPWGPPARHGRRRVALLGAIGFRAGTDPGPAGAAGQRPRRPAAPPRPELLLPHRELAV